MVQPYILNAGAQTPPFLGDFLPNFEPRMQNLFKFAPCLRQQCQFSSNLVQSLRCIALVKSWINICNYIKFNTLSWFLHFSGKCYCCDLHVFWASLFAFRMCGNRLWTQGACRIHLLSVYWLLKWIFMSAFSSGLFTHQFCMISTFQPWIHCGKGAGNNYECPTLSSQLSKDRRWNLSTGNTEWLTPSSK